MKNLFKNLMLVAVAAMAFTACQNDNEEVNKVDEVTVIEFTADLNATRSAFTGEKGETGYKSVWNGGEKVTVFVGDVAPNNNDTLTITTEDGVQGRFTAEFSSSLPAEGDIEAYVPAAGWENVWIDGGYVMTPKIPIEQTPSPNSVDPAAHILKSVQAYTGGVAANANLVFEHGVAYAKMTLNLGEVVAFGNIASVAVEIDDNQRYTLLSTDLEEPTFWFACEEATPTAMTVTITDNNEVTYVKELDLVNAAKPLTFANGVVSTFTVGGFEKVTIADVKSITASYDDYKNTFNFTVTEKNGGQLFLTGIQFNEAITSGMLPVEDELELQYDSEKVYWTDAKGSMKWIRDLYISVNQEAVGYTIVFAWSTDGTNEVPAEYDFADPEAPGLVYTGIIQGINNPPVPESVAVTTAPESVNGRAYNDGYDYTYYLSFVAGDWTITDLYFYAPVSSNGIIPVGEQTIRGGTATLTDTTWAFDITYGGTLTVAYSGENYVLTFAFEDANGSTYDFSFTGVIEGDNGILQPGAATPLATPSNLAYEVTATTATFSWGAVDGAGSYEVWYSQDGTESEHQTVTATSVQFTGLEMGKNYSFYVKALPATDANTESMANDVYAYIDYDPYTWVADNNVELTEVSASGDYTFTNANGDTYVVSIRPLLDTLADGTHNPDNNYGYPQYYDFSYNGTNATFNGQYFDEYYFFQIEKSGDNYAIYVGGKLENGTTYKLVFEGEIASASTDASTYVATSFQYQDDNNGGARLYKMVGDNFDINIWVNWHDDNNGTLSGDTLSYCYCPSEDLVGDYAYNDDSMWFCGTIDGAELSNNHGSTLAVSGNTATLTVYDANGSLLAVITAQL